MLISVDKHLKRIKYSVHYRSYMLEMHAQCTTIAVNNIQNNTTKTMDNADNFEVLKYTIKGWSDIFITRGQSRFTFDQ